jgi:maltose alpha-D-glucosyltransferase/alpha-amylase
MTLDVARLRETLPSRRWFGDKSRAIDSIHLIDELTLGEESPLVLALVEVRFDDGGSSLYHLPLLGGPDGERDAVEDPSRLGELGALMARGASLRGGKGTFHFGGAGLDPLSPPGADVRVMSREQSNTSIVLDERVILKLLRRVEWGPNPDLEIPRLLTGEGFDFIPHQVGDIYYEPDGEDPDRGLDLAVAQQYLPDAREGWDAVLEHLRRLLDEVHPSDVPEDMRVLIEDRSPDLLRALEDLGEVTGNLHVTLSREEMDADLRAEPIEQMDLKEWGERTRSLLVDLVPHVSELEDLRAPIEARLDALCNLEHPGLKARVHGDYHLGQVLHTGRGWMIVDFEGEPARSLEERRAKQSPLKDVAGMLRSFSYAAYAVLFERGEPGSEAWDRLEPWARTWEQLARERFLNAYLTRSHEGTFLPGVLDELALLLDFFEIDKALYELGYERGHRPGWIRIPLEGLRQVIGRGVA